MQQRSENSAMARDVSLPASPSSASTHAPVSAAAAKPAKIRRRWWFILVVLACGGLVAAPPVRPFAASAWARVAPHVSSLTSLLTGKGTAPPPAPPRVVPVVTAAISEGDMDLYLNGLGTVTAFYTVTLKSRVDGELMRVHFSEGQVVQQGDLLAEIDPRPYQVQLAEAEGQLARDEAALWGSEADLKRYTSLRANGTITQQEIDAATAIVKQNEGAIKIDRGRMDDAKLQLTYAKITAPISGRIGLRMVDPGNVVHANDSGGLAVITQLQPIAVVFTIPQDEITRVQRQLKSGQKLTVEAWNRGLTTQLAVGTLQAIDNQVDQSTGTLKLKAIFDNQDELLFPNQFVNARLLVDTRKKAITAPTAAIQRGPDSAFVYVVKDDSTVELRNVKTGPTEGDRTAIDSGAAAGELVVTEGLDKLQPGAKVAVQGSKPRSGKAGTEGKPTTDGKITAERAPGGKS